MDSCKRPIKIYWLLFVSCLSLIVSFCDCMSDLELFLESKYYDSYPYEYELSKIRDPGPVVFPARDDDAPVVNRYNIITINNVKPKHPVDDYPYTKVSEKVERLLFNDKYGSQENQIDQSYEKLPEYDYKVPSYSSEKMENYDEPSPNKDYQFAYKVDDKNTGDDFSHKQIKNSKVTNGEYRVKLPDGRLQIVSYKADKDGYKADVKYEEDPIAKQEKIIDALFEKYKHYYGSKEEEQERLPVKESASKGVDKYDFDEDEPKQKSNGAVLEQVSPTRIPVNYVDAGISSPLIPTAYLVEGPVNHGLKSDKYYYHDDKTYNSNQKDHSPNSYVSATPTPAYEKAAVRHTSTPLPLIDENRNLNNEDHKIFNFDIKTFGNNQNYYYSDDKPYNSNAKDHSDSSYVLTTPSPAYEKAADENRNLNNEDHKIFNFDIKPFGNNRNYYHSDDKHYNSNAKDHSHRNYVSTTPTPAYEKLAVRYPSTPVTLITDNHYINNRGQKVFRLDIKKIGHNQNAVSTTPYPVGDEYHKALAQENELPEGIYIIGKVDKT